MEVTCSRSHSQLWLNQDCVHTMKPLGPGHTFGLGLRFSGLKVLGRQWWLWGCLEMSPVQHAAWRAREEVSGEAGRGVLS